MLTPIHPNVNVNFIVDACYSYEAYVILTLLVLILKIQSSVIRFFHSRIQWKIEVFCRTGHRWLVNNIDFLSPCQRFAGMEW